MKFLVDNAISPMVAIALSEKGFDAIHVRQQELFAASDEVIFQKTFEENRIIISADTDFGFLLSKWPHSKPSVILFRGGIERNPNKQTELLLANFSSELIELLEKGAIVVIEPDKIRIRQLPF